MLKIINKHLIRKDNKLAVIDHILGLSPTNIQIIDKVNDITIFYDVPKMLDIIKGIQLIDDNREILLHKLDINEFVSDHKPIIRIIDIRFF